MSDDWDEEGDDAWGEFEEENPAMAVAVDPVVTTIDPKAISQQRLEWLKQVAKALQTFYKDTVTAGTPGKAKPDNRNDKTKLEHASTLLYSIYQDDYEKRERADKRAQEAKEREKEKELEKATESKDAPTDGPALRRAPSLRQQYSRDHITGPLRTPSCIVCMESFGSSLSPFKLTNCNHESVCTNCVRSLLNVKVDSRDIVPWVLCPVPDCKVPMHANDISLLLTPLSMYSLMMIYLIKHLSRDSLFTPCKNYQSLGVDEDTSSNSATDLKKVQKCCNGFLLTEEKEVREGVCQVCGLAQKIQKSEALDEDFLKMVKEGELRPCPKCKGYNHKEKGVCNVISCTTCGIWWNWRTRETGESSSELKAKARNNGSLWEPGELEYQQHLEQTNLEEFKKLLERNGMKYDPNYRRGGA